jgi:hypothetical protein
VSDLGQRQTSTLIESIGMSALCQRRTYANRFHPFEITVICAIGTTLVDDSRCGWFLFDRFCDPQTAISPLTWPLRKWGMAMDANHLREKATLCFRLADGLSLNNPSRFELMQMAEDFEKRAKELEARSAQHQQQSHSDESQSWDRRSR